MGARRRNASSSRKRQPTNTKPLRVYYGIARVLNLLQQHCLEALQDFPSVDSLQTFQAVEVGATSPNPAALLEVGRSWGATTSESGEMSKLCVWDRGGYHSDAPDLVPYTYRGQPGEARSERALIEANGFGAIGIFAELREYSTLHRNPKLDDPYVIALFQFIMMLRNNRRYYYYGERHQDPPEEHLKDLIGAMKAVTYRPRMARSSEVSLPILGAALSPQQPPPAQIAGSPHQNPYGLGNQQPYQQRSYNYNHLSEMKSPEVEPPPPSASLEPQLLTPSMDADQDGAQESEAYFK